VLRSISIPTIRSGATEITGDIPPVADFDLSKSYEFLHETFGQSVQSRGPALNINRLGEVPDSSWFTNRLGRHDMTIDEVVRGPSQVDGPAPSQAMPAFATRLSANPRSTP
jgi:hypothetical protein